MRANTKALSVAIVFLILVSFSISAEERLYAQKEGTNTFSLSRALLTEIHPDFFVINGKTYFRHSFVRFYQVDQNKNKKKIFERDVSLPSFVDIVYHTYSKRTESHPFKQGDKVVSSIIVQRKELPKP